MDSRPRARPQKRRRFQLHHHRPRDRGLPAENLVAGRNCYVVDDRQSGHFKKLFLIVARWKPDAAKSTNLIHVGFGKILGDDGKPFKTRSGDTVKLGDLLDEAEERAFKIVSNKSSGLDEAQRREIARVVGLGAVKYADLLPNRQ